MNLPFQIEATIEVAVLDRDRGILEAAWPNSKFVSKMVMQVSQGSVDNVINVLCGTYKCSVANVLQGLSCGFWLYMSNQDFWKRTEPNSLNSGLQDARG